MEPNAYSILDNLGLPHPRIISVDEIPILFEESPNAIVYLRGRPQSFSLNRRMYAAQALAMPLANMKKVGMLLSIEVGSRVLLGGAATVYPSGIFYIETCYGHTSGLLHHGFCAHRYYVEINSSRSYELHVPQPLSNWEEIDGSSESLPLEQRHLSAEKVGTSVFSILARKQETFAVSPPMLFEWIFEDGRGVLFVDVKQKAPFRDTRSFAVAAMPCSETIEDTLTAKYAEPRYCCVRDYCSDYSHVLARGPYFACLGNNALLCHFFTYSNHVPRRVVK